MAGLQQSTVDPEPVGSGRQGKAPFAEHHPDRRLDRADDRGHGAGDGDEAQIVALCEEVDRGEDTQRQ
jgi:hypothetical protein